MERLKQVGTIGHFVSLFGKSTFLQRTAKATGFATDIYFAELEAYNFQLPLCPEIR